MDRNVFTGSQGTINESKCIDKDTHLNNFKAGEPTCVGLPDHFQS